MREVIKVLVADDSKFIRNRIKECLGNTIFEIAGEASNGEELLNMASSICPDVIIADITMDKYDGIEAMRRIKKNGSDAKFLICSARSDMIHEAMEAGADDFILKPYNEEEFISVLNNIINN